MTENLTRSANWRDTVFLPKTDFPMKAGLAAKEPAILERWARIGVYDRLREQRKGRERFILHDGPPYANGDLHMGHAMNKILKDIVVRSQSLMGKDAPTSPAGTATACRSSGRSRKRIAPKSSTKTRFPRPSSAPNAAPMPPNGSISSASSSSGWASPATGTTPTSP
ncbi:tRNA synthetases class I (I, l, M and v) domain-containing protein [Ditylenchus destructor]|uniref:tRNA synthetases class I (I, l, M and v) domain-containing protein n=1 Tax=Ditylenchus destructor TaxID=166010 RepID=A0AAD4QRM2_9BILA|nr:tRNA synthetases class I (I, l, M and v) domain-containing protein [Ditylenchus destructor]